MDLELREGMHVNQQKTPQCENHQHRGNAWSHGNETENLGRDTE